MRASGRGRGGWTQTTVKAGLTIVGWMGRLELTRGILGSGCYGSGE